MMWLLIMVIIIISVLILIFYRYYIDRTSSKQRQIATVMQELYRRINDVCYRSNIVIAYRLIVDETMNFVEDNQNNVYNIHLVVWNEQYKRPYDLNSLLYIALSELMTITGRSELLLIAQQLGHYDIRTTS
jgi:hypothetical protein